MGWWGSLRITTNTVTIDSSLCVRVLLTLCLPTPTRSHTHTHTHTVLWEPVVISCVYCWGMLRSYHLHINMQAGPVKKKEEPKSKINQRVYYGRYLMDNMLMWGVGKNRMYTYMEQGTAYIQFVATASKFHTSNNILSQNVNEYCCPVKTTCLQNANF